MLEQDCLLDHQVIIYHGATLPIQQPRVRHVGLRDLPATDVTAEETMVLPPASALHPNQVVRERLAVLDCAQLAQGHTS